MPFPIGVQLVAAEGAEPRQQGGFAAVRVQLADRLADGRLRDFRRGIAVEVEPCEREAVKCRIRGLEESFEGSFVPV